MIFLFAIIGGIALGRFGETGMWRRCILSVIISILFMWLVLLPIIVIANSNVKITERTATPTTFQVVDSKVYIVTPKEIVPLSNYSSRITSNASKPQLVDEHHEFHSEWTWPICIDHHVKYIEVPLPAEGP